MTCVIDQVSGEKYYSDLANVYDRTAGSVGTTYARLRKRKK